MHRSTCCWAEQVPVLQLTGLAVKRVGSLQGCSWFGRTKSAPCWTSSWTPDYYALHSEGKEACHLYHGTCWHAEQQSTPSRATAQAQPQGSAPSVSRQVRSSSTSGATRGCGSLTTSTCSPSYMGTQPWTQSGQQSRGIWLTEPGKHWGCQRGSSCMLFLQSHSGTGRSGRRLTQPCRPQQQQH
jgi:hypothetical protein